MHRPRLPLIPLIAALSGSPAVADSEAAPATPEAARAAAMALLKTLGGELGQAMGDEGGPQRAIGVCRERAPAIARDLSLEHGWRVTRVSGRPRNALLGTADAWEQQVLADFESRHAEGEDFGPMEFHAVVEEPQGRYLRYMKAIGTRPLCLTCHGDPAAMPEALRSTLDQAYPHDAARGYQVGDLRGAVSIKAPLP